MKPLHVTFNTAVAATGALLIAIYIIFGGSFTTKLLTKKKLRKKGTTIPGLANVGNTCFLNCILQALASCPSYLKWLQSTTDASAEDSSPVLLHSLQKVIKGLNEETDGENADANVVLRALRCHGWVISVEEQDAHELFHALTSTLHDEITQVNREASSLLNVSWIACEEDGNFSEDDVRPPSRGQGQVARQGRAEQGQVQSIPKSELVMESTQSLQQQQQGNPSKIHLPMQPPMEKSRDNWRASSIISKVSSLRQHHYSGNNTSSSALESPFKGHLASQLQCTVCGFKNGVHWSTFESVSLSLPPSPLFLQSCGLYELLDAFVRPERIADVMCDGCSKANGSPSHTTFSKKLSIGKLPVCLCLHIQRTVWLENGCAVKRKDFVAVPEFVNMDPYTYTGSLSHQQKVKGGLLGGREAGLITPILSQNGSESVALRDLLISNQLSGDLSSNRNRAMDHSLYRLEAVIVHIGDVFSGHFITYRRAPANSSRSRDSWFYTSDIVVKEVPFEEVRQSNAYMIIYERLSI